MNFLKLTPLLLLLPSHFLFLPEALIHPDFDHLGFPIRKNPSKERPASRPGGGNPPGHRTAAQHNLFGKTNDATGGGAGRFQLTPPASPNDVRFHSDGENPNGPVDRQQLNFCRQSINLNARAELMNLRVGVIRPAPFD